jgi:SAM-dependent methyltransferase
MPLGTLFFSEAPSFALPPSSADDLALDESIGAEKRGIFDLSHVLLNADLYATQWGNLGFWPPVPAEPALPAPHEYAAACATMASDVFAAAGVIATDTVLDVGFGCGDEILLLSGLTVLPASASTGAGARTGAGVGAGAAAPGWVPPRSVIGLNLVSSQVQWARARVKQACAARGGPTTSASPASALAAEVTLHHGSAADVARVTAPGSVHRVVCVDTAYHFERRAAFFADVFTALAPGGRLALTDLVIPDDAVARARRFRRTHGLPALPGDDGVSTAAARLSAPLTEAYSAIPSLLLGRATVHDVCRGSLLRLASALSVPGENLMTAAEYAATLAAAGFVNVRLVRQEHRVFDGFAAFVRVRPHVFCACLPDIPLRLSSCVIPR